ncbi:ATP-binding cassette, subfamily C [Aliiroseovarius halocynthiae]|uniref:Type I secretion system permease/ATPase n=1 Tax=Aliiroseovarius halocynthiae TaxID=985055 RepID=A0A545SZH7_9RHOB|nr:type I secretion system permease/ATPase [Aliiroseovarius halocynthiae]TQV70378.1 type I secretion system permease/ATPase [Aliiroseovarius halocynthiae]SMR81909.1 ATP-binding cassette, subfamily C [Aliiroseovarius halocynthiae]
MKQIQLIQGLEELRTQRRKLRSLMWSVGLFSVFVNLLMLTAPIYMLQLYDRVLGSRSEATLIALTLLMAFLFLIMGVLDYSRTRILARAGAQFQASLDQRVFSAVMRQADNRGSTAGLKDLEAVQKLLSSPVITAAFDIPWTPFFLFAISVFHPWLGILAVSGGGCLIAITVLNQMFSKGPLTQATIASHRAEQMAEQMRVESEMVRALGMSSGAYKRWYQSREQSLFENLRASDRLGQFSAMSKTFRQFLQSAMLGLGAYLALKGEISPGAMIAGSILLGRALAPVDTAVNQWQVVQRARSGWQALAELLADTPPEQERTALPRPEANLRVENLTVIPRGAHRAVLRQVNFDMKPGEALGVIGPSGAGKSTLARVLTGVVTPDGGVVRLGGASLDNYSPEALGRYVGYLPQRVQLFEGTIAENIAGLDLQPDSEAVVAAAQMAGAHELILSLPDGYDTPISPGGATLSGGQMQRVGLARALYGEPVLLVLDEPNSNLDNEGTQALNRAIRAVKARGGAIMIMAHRPAAIQECELLLIIDGGTARGFGPRDDVLKAHVQNAQQIQSTQTNGGTQ